MCEVKQYRRTPLEISDRRPRPAPKEVLSRNRRFCLVPPFLTYSVRYVSCRSVPIVRSQERGGGEVLEKKWGRGEVVGIGIE